MLVVQRFSAQALEDLNLFPWLKGEPLWRRLLGSAVMHSAAGVRAGHCDLCSACVRWAAARKLAVTLPVSQRGIRLGVEFLIRNEREPENDRYCRRREQAGAAWRWGSFFISTLPGLLT